MLLRIVKRHYIKYQAFAFFIDANENSPVKQEVILKGKGSRFV